MLISPYNYLFLTFDPIHCRIRENIALWNWCQCVCKVSQYVANVKALTHWSYLLLFCPIFPSCWMPISPEPSRSRKRNSWRTTASHCWPTSCTSTRAARGSSNASWRCCLDGRWAWRLLATSACDSLFLKRSRRRRGGLKKVVTFSKCKAAVRDFGTTLLCRDECNTQ